MMTAMARHLARAARLASLLAISAAFAIAVIASSGLSTPSQAMSANCRAISDAAAASVPVTKVKFVCNWTCVEHKTDPTGGFHCIKYSRNCQVVPDLQSRPPLVGKTPRSKA